MNTLKAEKRNLAIKAKKLRREGYVTGNVFGKEMKESIPVQMDKSTVDRLLKTCGKGSQIMLEIEGESYNVLIKDVEFNPLKGQIDEIDFQALVSNEKVHSVAEVVLLGHEKITEGVIQQHLEEISYRALPAALVDKVKIDVGSMRVGDSVKVGDLEIAKNPEIDLLTDPEMIVVSINEPHTKAEDTAEESENAAEYTFQLNIKNKEESVLQETDSFFTLSL